MMLQHLLPSWHKRQKARVHSHSQTIAPISSLKRTFKLYPRILQANACDIAPISFTLPPSCIRVFHTDVPGACSICCTFGNGYALHRILFFLILFFLILFFLILFVLTARSQNLVEHIRNLIFIVRQPAKRSDQLIKFLYRKLIVIHFFFSRT